MTGQGWGHWQLRVWIYPQPVPMSSQDGVWVRGLYLEGAGWDRKNSCLVEAEPMQLVCLMPTIHFRPTESRKKSAKGGTVCPLPSLPAPSLVSILTQPPPHPSPTPAPALLFQRLQGLIHSALLSCRHVFLSLLLLSQPGRQLRPRILRHWHRSPLWDHDL